MYPRPLDADTTMDVLEELGTVKADPLWDAMVDAKILPRQRDEVINRLLNHKHEDSALSMQAKTLARNPEPAGSMVRVSYSDKTITGRLGGVLESSNGGVAIEIDGRLVITAGNTTVYVWPREEPKVNTFVCGEVIGDHLAYGRLVCDLPKGHSSAHEQKEKLPQCTKTRDGIQCAYNEGHVGNPATGHNFSKQFNALRGQRTLPRKSNPTWTEYQAEFLWMNRDWVTDGRQIEFQDGFVQVHGKVTDAWLVSTGDTTPEKIFLVVDGKIHPMARSFKVRVSEPIS